MHNKTLFGEIASNRMIDCSINYLFTFASNSNNLHIKCILQMRNFHFELERLAQLGLGAIRTKSAPNPAETTLLRAAITMHLSLIKINVTVRRSVYQTQRLVVLRASHSRENRIHLYTNSFHFSYC